MDFEISFRVGKLFFTILDVRIDPELSTYWIDLFSLNRSGGYSWSLFYAEFYGKVLLDAQVFGFMIKRQR